MCLFFLPPAGRPSIAGVDPMVPKLLAIFDENRDGARRMNKRP